MLKSFLVLSIIIVLTIGSNLNSVNVTFAYPNDMKFIFSKSDNTICTDVKCPPIYRDNNTYTCTHCLIINTAIVMVESDSNESLLWATMFLNPESINDSSNKRGVYSFYEGSYIVRISKFYSEYLATIQQTLIYQKGRIYIPIILEYIFP